MKSSAIALGVFTSASQSVSTGSSPPATWKPVDDCVDEIMHQSRNRSWGFTAEHEATLRSAPGHAGLNHPTGFNLRPHSIFSANWRDMMLWLVSSVDTYNRTYGHSIRFYNSINVGVTTFGRQRRPGDGSSVEVVGLNIVEANGDPLQGRDDDRCLPGIELVVLLALNPHMIPHLAPNCYLGALGLSAYNTDSHLVPSFSYSPNGAGAGQPELYLGATPRYTHVLAYKELDQSPA